MSRDAGDFVTRREYNAINLEADRRGLSASAFLRQCAWIIAPPSDRS